MEGQVHKVSCIARLNVVCPRDAALVTPIKEVKGSRGAMFIESKKTREDNMVFKTLGMCFGRTTYQVCS
jgi:hypothetical protein